MLEIAKLMDYDDFLYTKVITQRPLRLWYEDITGKYASLCTDESFDQDAKKNLVLKVISGVKDVDVKRSDSEFFAYLKEQKIKVAAADIKYIRNTFGTISEDAPKVHEKPLKSDSALEPDSNLSDSECIPFKEDIDEYFAREVSPFAPDAWMDRSKDKIGCEFPFTKLFYIYKPLRSSEVILNELDNLDKEMANEISSLKGDK